MVSLIIRWIIMTAAVLIAGSVIRGFHVDRRALPRSLPVEAWMLDRLVTIRYRDYGDRVEIAEERVDVADLSLHPGEDDQGAVQMPDDVGVQGARWLAAEC